MALIACPECGREVSDRAPACPHCGCPIADEIAPHRTSASVTPPAWQSVQTIEQTGKHWKKLQLFGALGVVVGVGALVAAFSFVLGRVGAWWHHG